MISKIIQGRANQARPSVWVLFTAAITLCFTFTYPVGAQASKTDDAVQVLLDGFEWRDYDNGTPDNAPAARVIAMAEADRRARNYLMNILQDQDLSDKKRRDFMKAFFPRINEMDERHRTDLKRLLELIDGWFIISEYGEEADSAAWLIVMHADKDPDFQKEILEVLRPLAEIGETSPRNFAQMTDRIAVNDNKRQVYGTQLTCKKGKLVPEKIEDPENVEARRKAVGLPPLAEKIAEEEEKGSPCF